MTQEDKELLFKDLCARLPYGVKFENFSHTYNKNGIFYTSGLSDNNDLFFAPETHEGWINVYRNNDSHTYAGAVYDSKEDAEKRKESDENYVATIKIEWEE